MEDKGTPSWDLVRHNFWFRKYHENWQGPRKVSCHRTLILPPLQQINTVLSGHECPYDLAHGSHKGSSCTTPEHWMLRLLDILWLLRTLRTCTYRWARRGSRDRHDEDVCGPRRVHSTPRRRLLRNPLKCRKGSGRKERLDELRRLLLLLLRC